MNAKDIARDLEIIRDPRIAICKSFLRKRGLDLSSDTDLVWSRCLSEASGNNPEAQYVLSTLFLTGMLGRQDEEMGVRWCTKAAAAGYLPATYTLGDLSIFGEAGATSPRLE
jgi:TPR repeat protein